LHIWDAKTGAELASWRVPSSTYTLAGSADLSRLVTGYAHEGATLWDATNGRLIATLEPAGHWVRTLAMSLDGSLVITGSDDGAIRFFHGDSGAPAGDPLKLEARVTALTLSPDQRQLAVTDSKGRARVYGLDSRALLLDVQAHPTWIEDIQYSADGAWLVTAGRQDHIAKTWDARTGALRSTLAGHGDNLVRASFSPEGARVATVSTDNTARLWDAATGQLLRVIRGPAYTARFSQDGSELLTTGTRDYMVIWDVSLDSRTPEAIAGLVGQRSPWQLEAGRLIPRADAP
jgi:WD40 repeat protein